MNLHLITSGALKGAFPDSEKAALIRVSTGFTKDASFKQVPAYREIPATGRLQSLSTGDIKRLEFLNVQGVQCKMYLSGNFEGVIRDDQRGGDLVIFDGKTYLISAVLERWPTWCCVALTMQVTE